MNKYQKFILDRTLCFVSKDMTVGSKAYFNSFINNDGEFEVKQDENYNIKQHFIVLSGLTVSFVELDGVKYESTNFENHTLFDKKMIGIPVDFDKPAKELKLYFIDNFADALSIKLKFVAADKGLYDAKMHDALIKERTKTANIKVSTGADLVNIYFQPCCDSYARTEITLYKDNMMLAKYKIDEEAFFKSIGGLAYGKYTFVLKQFDKDSNALFETGKIEFTISAPKTPEPKKDREPIFCVGPGGGRFI
jgi:hypothetical protein